MAVTPSHGELLDGVTDDDVREAVGSSGYPLQVEVAAELRRHFQVQDEWSFVDADTGKLRALDLHARSRLGIEVSGNSRLRPTLDLLIECKRSRLPYVFFRSPTPDPANHFPVLCGLRSDKLKVTVNGEGASFTGRVPGMLGLGKHPFVSPAVPTCSTLSKCVRKGKKLMLSGDEPYNNIVRPLVKAVRHLSRAERPSPSFMFFDMHIALAVAVLDAPMAVVELGDEGPQTEYAPWVRLVRHEFDEDEGDHFAGSRFYVVDFVHRSAVREYVESHAIPYAAELAERALRHHREVAEGRGVVSSDPWSKTNSDNGLRAADDAEFWEDPAAQGRDLRRQLDEALARQASLDAE